MTKNMEMNGILRIKIKKPGERSVTYTAELILSEEDKFQLQQDILTTELTLAVRTNLAHGQEDGDRARGVKRRRSHAG